MGCCRIQRYVRLCAYWPTCFAQLNCKVLTIWQHWNLACLAVFGFRQACLKALSLHAGVLKRMYAAPIADIWLVRACTALRLKCQSPAHSRCWRDLEVVEEGIAAPVTDSPCKMLPGR